MTTTQPDAPLDARSPVAETRPFAWLVRRELWENRYLYVAPVLVAEIVLLASMFATFTRVRRIDLPSNPATLHAAAGPFQMAPAPIMLVALVIGIFYCLDALYGERRDRSILFWKSLPVSDRTTVLSKASIPMMVLPAMAIGLSVVIQVVLIFVGSAIMLGRGMSPVPLWGELRFFEGLPIMVYGLSVHVLWFAPIYAWLLLASAWARRAAFLWAVLPLMAVAAVERIVFGTTRFLALLHYRVGGAMKEAFVSGPAEEGNVERLWQLDPVTFLAAPGLWLGLLFAAACLVAAVRLRRNREPI
ncbi:MAG: ABC transporter permease [Thermoanaerobaculia bacterium]